MGEEIIQELWSGYGEIVRMPVADGTVIVKRVRSAKASSHPRGWATDRSHERKVRSYEVETAWYRDYSTRCDARCRVPDCLALSEGEEGVVITLEDLDVAGFPGRLGSLGAIEIEACLHWLAHFHATFMGCEPTGLWPVGTYWHVDTRPDELDALGDLPLKAAASAIDARLTSAKFQTFVHGDAKLANFCFSKDGSRVAAVDFQYVGGGCGMKDVAYFVGSCLNERECESQETSLLNTYFSALQEALGERHPHSDAEAVIAEWRALYPVAWTDFHRFLKGWSPGHWKINSYSERLAREVVGSVA
jgi:hypothetical protein